MKKINFYKKRVLNDITLFRRVLFLAFLKLKFKTSVNDTTTITKCYVGFRYHTWVLIYLIIIPFLFITEVFKRIIEAIIEAIIDSYTAVKRLIEEYKFGESILIDTFEEDNEKD